MENSSYSMKFVVGVCALVVLATAIQGFLMVNIPNSPYYPDELTILWTEALESYCNNSPLTGAKVMEVSRLVLEGVEFTTDKCPLILGTNLLQDWDSQSIIGEQLLLLDGDVFQAWGNNANQCFIPQPWHIRAMEFLTDLGC